MSFDVKDNRAFMGSGQQEKDFSVCFRLKEERNRIGKSQQDIAEALGMNVKTVTRWENSVAIPADKLATLASIGMDVLYVITGQRTPAPPKMSPVEWLSIDRPGSSNIDERAKVIGYDLKTRQPLLLAAISNDPDVELCIAGDREPVAIRDEAAYVSTTWMAKNYPDTQSVCEAVEKRIEKHFSGTDSADSDSEMSPEEKMILAEIRKLSQENQRTLYFLAQALHRKQEIDTSLPKGKPSGDNWWPEGMMAGEPEE